MDLPNRRALLAAAAALGATAAASAQDSNEPVIDNKGASIVGPRNQEREQQNPDIQRPPSTDHGSVPNLRFSFADAHMKIRKGGWSREVTQRELPISTTMARVNMRLKSGGVRELHWHKQAEWAFMLAGKARITAVDNDGHSFISGCRRRRPLVLSLRHPALDSGICRTTAANSCSRSRMANFLKTPPFAIADLFAHNDRRRAREELSASTSKPLDRHSERGALHLPGRATAAAGAGGRGQQSARSAVPLDMVFRLTQQQPHAIAGR